MNAKPYLSWGMYGAVLAAERPNYFVSWGLFADAPSPTPPSLVQKLLMFFGLGN